MNIVRIHSKNFRTYVNVGIIFFLSPWHIFQDSGVSSKSGARPPPPPPGYAYMLQMMLQEANIKALYE